MISKEAQYRIYAGTKKDDFTGWEKIDVENEENVEFWSLDIGNGYRVDRVIKNIRTLFGIKSVRYISIRRDRTLEDPDGDFKDTDFNVLFDVEIMVSNDAIKFNSKNNSFVLLSREPVDWDQFSSGVPKFKDETKEENWSSFYR